MKKDNNHLEDFPKSVGILYSEVKREYFPTEARYITEKDAKSHSELVGKYIADLGIDVKLYEGVPEVTALLKKDKPDMVFNLTGSIKGQEYLASAIPGILEAMEIPYTGAGILGESLSYNKFLTKDLLNSHGIPVPNFQLMTHYKSPLYQNLRFPLISKLNEVHGSVEISADAVSENEKHLRERVKFLTDTYQQEVLVEEFIFGKEISVFLLEGKNKKVYMGEVSMANGSKYQLIDFDNQWVNMADPIQYIKYEDKGLKSYVKRAFNVLNMDDYGKFDVRVDESGRYYFIDANTNPFFGPKELQSQIAKVLEIYGVNFKEILRRLLINTMREAKGKEALPL